MAYSSGMDTRTRRAQPRLWRPFMSSPGSRRSPSSQMTTRTAPAKVAAREVEARWREARREARILLPETCGDLNGILRGAAA